MGLWPSTHSLGGIQGSPAEDQEFSHVGFIVPCSKGDPGYVAGDFEGRV